MDDHSPARGTKREPDPDSAGNGARDRAAGAIVPGPPGVTTSRPPAHNTGATPSGSPPAPGDRGGNEEEVASAATRGHRSGNDERQRGWFWHWNGIVTQFAPLIGLKGIGLLNSYTVWTDRREDSPHRGYAFPSQQSEANFYGEDRAELITINKILVALDLIEVRKEMVLKVDEKGRRWRVPHNFYRVKDRPNGLDLTTEDVIRVIELAERDAAVYRYIRKVFSSKFEPIDRDNVWHRILPEVASHPGWQKLAEKAARQEVRASARTRAGHKSRNKSSGKREKREAANEQGAGAPGALLTTGHHQDPTFNNTQHTGLAEVAAPPIDEGSNNGSAADVERINRGLRVTDEETNNGSTGTEDTTDASANNGEPGTVEPGNTTYYQSSTTTTTTDSDQILDPSAQNDMSGNTPGASQATPGSRDAIPLTNGDGRGLAVPVARGESPGPTGLSENAGGRGASGGAPQRGVPPVGGRGPVGDPGPLVVSLFEAANDRRATPLERILLSELERDAAAPAQAAGSTGSDWVAAALREAVGSGSAFVAPKRIREIINRWAAEGAGPRGPELASNDATAPTPLDGPATSHDEDLTRHVASVVSELLGAMLGETLHLSSVEVMQRGGALEVLIAASEADSEALAGCRQRLERSLASEMGQPVTFRIASEREAAGSGAATTQSQPYVISAGDAARGRQLWLAVLDDLSTRIPASDLTRLRDVTVLGQGERGEVYLGTTNRLASRYLSGRHLDAVQRSLGSLLSWTTAVVVLEQDQWRIGDPSGQ